MKPQDAPVRIRLTLLPEDQERLADLTARLDLSPGQVLRAALASYERTLNAAAQLRASEHATRLLDEGALDRVSDDESVVVERNRSD